MGTYVADASEVQPRAGNRAITSTSKPSTSEVGDWIDEAEAELEGALAAAGIPTSYAAGARGFKILRAWIGSYVAGLVRVSWAASAGDGGNEDGRREITEWKDRLRDIAADPSRFSAMLSSAGSSASNTVGLASHVTDSSLGLSASDYAPVFTIKGNNF